MGNLIQTMVIVLPGFAAMIISGTIGPGPEKNLSDFEKAMYGVLFNIPIGIITWAVLSLLQQNLITSYSTLQSLFGNIPFDIGYAVGQFLLAWYVAYQWVFKWRERTERFVNKQRGKRGLPDTNHQAPYEGFFANSESPIIEICGLKDNTVYHRGILKKASSIGSPKQMIMTEDDYRLPWLDTLKVHPRATLAMLSDGLVLKKYEAVDLAAAIDKYVGENPNYLS